ncbi:hypothetical protein ES708_09144 [subsurface metagenome]
MLGAVFISWFRRFVTISLCLLNKPVACFRIFELPLFHDLFTSMLIA